MSLAEALDITHMHHVAGRTGDRTAVVTTRPFRTPYHTISDVEPIGGGQVPIPGDVSLAHHGMHLLEARPECRRHVLEVASLSRRVSHQYNLQSVLTLSDFASIANWLLTASCSG